MIKALGLLSGGLDSILATKVLQEQGIEITAISFTTPFFDAEKAKNAAKLLKIPLIVEDITEEHLKMLLNPKYGYGSGMNPCIDCHTLMLKIAGRIMKEKRFDFVFTGEVLGERPMSQNRRALHVIAKESGYKDYILRPLSAKLLPETKPEMERKVDSSKLLDIVGRQRKRQFEMAKKYKIKDGPTPGGGCLLTDPCFSGRLKDLLRRKKRPTLHDIKLLKVGRHVSLDQKYKIIIGRNEKDNNLLDSMSNKQYILFMPKDILGPHCIIPQRINEKLLSKAMKTCASYCDAQEGDKIIFQEKGTNSERRIMTLYSRSNRPKEFIGAI